MEKKDKRKSEAELIDYYDRFNEKNRLFEGVGKLELARTKDIVTRYLRPPPAVVYDIGGATGVYSLWLAREGYAVHLVDPVPAHIEQALQASEGQSHYPIASCRVGDARSLNFPDDSADAMLFFGPMYHLHELPQRRLALREAVRVVRPGGIIFVAAISRFASILDGLVHFFLDDPAFQKIVKQDLGDGQHRNPTGNPLYFTDTFFHHPDELRAEIESVGLHCEILLPVEGIGGLLRNFEDHWGHEERQARLMEALRWIETEPSLLGVSQHILAVAKKRAVNHNPDS
ncbi:class I SAM-dependent methyltransferase [Acidobacteriota bacterium]